MKTNGLGKGLEGLIPSGFDVGSVIEPREQIRQLGLEFIQPNPSQPRRLFDEDAINDLAASIKEHGIIQPLVVTPSGNEKYRIVAGERRYRASIVAGLSKVPAIVRNHQELEELEVALVENVQRVDLSPLEQALSIVKLRDQFSLTPKEIAKKLGKAETTISNIVRLLQLPESAIEALQTGKLTEGHARALLSLKNNPTKQRLLEKKIIQNKLSVREAETEANKLKKENEQKDNSLRNSVIMPYVKKLEQAGHKVKIAVRKNGGAVTLHYKNEDELLELFKKITR
jgi:ParB family chromosome partitioning protein